MSWSHYLQLIRQEKTDLQEWHAIVQENENEGDPVGELGAAMYDALDEARHKSKVFRGIASILLSFIKQAAALQEQVDELEREARENADLLAAAQERVAELENTVDEAQLQADEYREELEQARTENALLHRSYTAAIDDYAAARTEVLFLQDRVSPQSTFEGLQELFKQQEEIEYAIRYTAGVVFAPTTTVYWDHNGHTQRGRVQRVEYELRGGRVWVVNANTNVTRRLDVRRLRTEAIAADAAYRMETADVA